MTFHPVLTLPLLAAFTLSVTACSPQFLAFFGIKPPSSSPLPDAPGRAPASVAFDRAEYRVRLGVDPAIDGWDAAVLEAATLKATVRWEGGATEPLVPGNAAWNWELPSGLRLVSRTQGSMLVAESAATGSYVLRLASATLPTVQATASVRVSDDGSADVVIQ